MFVKAGVAVGLTSFEIYGCRTSEVVFNFICTDLLLGETGGCLTLLILLDLSISVGAVDPGMMLEQPSPHNALALSPIYIRFFPPEKSFVLPGIARPLPWRIEWLLLLGPVVFIMTST